MCNQRGSAILELSIIMPLLALMAVGVTNFGLVLGEKQIIVEAARYGARRAAAEGQAFCVSEASSGFKSCDQILVDSSHETFAGISPVTGDDQSLFLATYYACQSIEQAGLSLNEWQVKGDVEADASAPTVTVSVERAMPAGYFVSALVGPAFPSTHGTFVNQQVCDLSSGGTHA